MSFIKTIKAQPADFSIGRAWMNPNDVTFVICNNACEKVGFTLREIIGIDRYYVI